MNPIVEETPDYLIHYGTPRHSGRYPWGSGKDPYQRTSDFLSRVQELKREGWEETPENIKEEFNLTTTQYRAQKGLARDERKLDDISRVRSLRSDGLGWTEIGKIMGKPESSIRSMLNPDVEANARQAKETADKLRDEIRSKGPIDIGANTERLINVSKEKLNQAVALLEAEGYVVKGGRVNQPNNPGKMTTMKVIFPPGAPKNALYEAMKHDDIHSFDDYISPDNGKTFEKKFTYPESMDSKRLKIVYNEEGGLNKDGVIELRRGVKDLSLGNSRYAQVRILVDGTHYLKGMAVYGDDMPDGIDVIFNTNKPIGTPMEKVLKDIKPDPENPFGSAIKDAALGGQYWYEGADGKKHLGLINKRADEGDWTEWSNSLPSQFLSKQSRYLAEKQLHLAIADKENQFDELTSLTNPTLKKHLLMKFADECDSASVHLQAAALPGQKYHVIIPVNTLSDTEIYAPGYDPGTKLALIRYPHAGTFEIPILTVNNKNPLGNKIIGPSSIDAVGINKKNADRLSGADFDGDTVMCIPTNDRAGKVKITSTPALEGLEGFDPTMSYGPDNVVVDSEKKAHYYRNGREYRKMSEAQKQIQMGVISNLITDMTLIGATNDELAAAARHSMVVIDSVKHSLDYKQSERDNHIDSLKRTYQTYVDAKGVVHEGGAATLLSRSKGQHPVDKRQGAPRVNIKGKSWYDPSKPEGALVYKTADDLTYSVAKVNPKTGEVTTSTKRRTQNSTHMAETNDARTLISEADTVMERLYADYANGMKSLANRARVVAVNTAGAKYDAQANRVYAKEVSSLLFKLNNALMNAPRERQANIKAYAEVESKIAKVMADNPGKTRKEAKKLIDVKKTATQALSRNRTMVGSISRKERSITIDDKEWEAIQAGAISDNKVKSILANADIDELRQRAMPKSNGKLTPTQINTIKAMSASNYTLSDIANKLGVSTSTVSKYLKGKE